MSKEYADRSKVKAELQKIEERDGVLRPEAVVEFAKNEKTELHKEFTWNDEIAGQQYRLWQARQLIRTIVSYLPREDEEYQVKTFVHFDDPEDGYISITKVLSDEELRLRMLATAKKELKAFQVKYAELKELTSVFSAIEHILDQEPEEVQA